MSGWRRDGAPIRIMAVDDHAVVRTGLRAVFDGHRDIDFVGAAADRIEAIELCRSTVCDVALVDLRLRDESGVDVIRALKAEGFSCRTVVFTSFGTQQYVHEAISAGANGFLLKSAEPVEIVKAVRTVHTGCRYLSPEVAEMLADYVQYARLTQRELEILELLVPGTRNRSIADKLGIGEETVKGHLKKIFAKLGVRDRTEAATQAIQRGLVRID